MSDNKPAEPALIKQVLIIIIIHKVGNNTIIIIIGSKIANWLASSNY